jgi:hypothetical protein
MYFYNQTKSSRGTRVSSTMAIINTGLMLNQKFKAFNQVRQIF